VRVLRTVASYRRSAKEVLERYNGTTDPPADPILSGGREALRQALGMRGGES
jgi:hypothetical protein